MYDISEFIAVLNPPQSTIFAVGSTSAKAMPDGKGGVEARQVFYYWYYWYITTGTLLVLVPRRCLMARAASRRDRYITTSITGTLLQVHY